jgi:hypothetical protein
MQITSDLLLGKKKCRNKQIFEGILTTNLQPILFLEVPDSDIIHYFQQFGNDYFMYPWDFIQENSKNVIKIKEAKHKVIKNEEIEFLLAYNEKTELTFDFLHTLAKGHSRCTFVLTLQNLKNVISTMQNFTTKNFKNSTKTREIKHDIDRQYDKYVFTLSIYSMSNLVTNFKNKTIDGMGISIEVLDIKNTDYYKIPYISFGFYLMFTNNYNDVFYRDCVEMFNKNYYTYEYIINKLHKYEILCDKYEKVKQETFCDKYEKVITPNYKINKLEEEPNLTHFEPPLWVSVNDSFYDNIHYEEMKNSKKIHVVYANMFDAEFNLPNKNDVKKNLKKVTTMLEI